MKEISSKIGLKRLNYKKNQYHVFRNNILTRSTYKNYHYKNVNYFKIKK